MKNKITLTIIILIICTMQNIYAQIPNWLWAKDAWGNNNVEGISTATDGIGNVYVSGYFLYGPINFNNIQITGHGDYDGFLVKYDPNGNFLWAKTIGGFGSDKVYGVNTDNSGNVIVTGYYQTSIVLGLDTLINIGGGSSDMFIVKFDSNGTVLWAKSSSSISFGGAAGNSVITDGNGNIYVTGEYHFYGVIFDLDTLPNTLGYDLFVVKYDSNGNVLWTNSANATGDEKPTGIALDNFNDIYITGSYYNSNLIFGGDTLIHSLPVNTNNVFCLKLNNNGNKVWARSASGSSNGTGIIKDNNGDILVTGTFGSATITFGGVTLNQGLASTSDLFIVKYNINGNVDWAKSGGGVSVINSNCIAVDQHNDIYIAGHFNSPQIIFGSDTISTFGAFADAFLAKFDLNGNALRATKMGGTSLDVATSITIDATDNVIVAGSYKSSSFYPLGLSNGSAGVYNYMYVAKTTGLISGLDIEANNKEIIKLYPNPSNGEFTISFFSYAIKARIEIYSTIGEKMYSKEINNSFECKILFENISAGIYFIKVIDGDMYYNKKIIIE